MTSTTWSRRYLAYLRAHEIDPRERVEIKATEVQAWIAAQARLFRSAHPESLDFDGWLDKRFPEPSEVAG